MPEIGIGIGIGILNYDPDFDPARRIDPAQGVSCHLDLGSRRVPAPNQTYPVRSDQCHQP